jgi:hypothetical protein
VKDYFDRIVVISLRRRRDRLRHMLARMKKVGWPFLEPQVFDAIDGNAVPCPRAWLSGGGAYGCQQSHLQVLQRAIMDGVERLLVLEDDAEFRDTFLEDVSPFMQSIPPDWECLMLGGQHMAPPSHAGPGWVRCRNTQRTHCYAVTREGMLTLASLWSASVNHIDWDMGPKLGQRKKTYAPSVFVVGQAAARSDICGRRNPAQFWNAPREGIATLWLRAPRSVAEKMREHGCHYGMSIDSEGNDSGLNTIFPSPGSYAGGIQNFLTTIKWECESFPDKPGIATIWHPNATAQCAEKLLADCAPAVIEAGSLEDAASQAERLFGDLFFLRPTPTRPPVLLLKTTAEAVTALRQEGLVHTGNWREPATDRDVGLSRIIADGGRCLREWFQVLDMEAEWKNAVVGIWHPDADITLAETTGRRVVVIDAQSAEDAVRQARAAID